jgi:WD40 repeat protein
LPANVDGRGVAISPDASTVAFIDAKGKVRLGNGNGKPGPVLTKSDNLHMASVMFTTDGKFLAGLSQEGPLVFWEAKSGKLARESVPLRLKTIPATAPGIFALAFAPDGRTLAANGSDQKLRLWDLPSGKQSLELPSSASGIGFTPDGRSLFAFGVDSMWELDTVKRKRVLGFDRAAERQALLPTTLSSDGATLVVGDRIWDTKKNVQRHRLAGHPTRVVAVAISPDGKTVATACGGPRVYLWDAGTGRFLRDLFERKLEVHSVAFAPDGKTLAAGSQDGVVRIWEVAKAYLIRECAGPKGDIVAVAFSPDGKTIAAGSPDGTVRLWEAATGKERQRYKEHQAAVTALAFSPTGRQLASGAADHTTVVWDVVAPKPGVQAPQTRQQIKDLWDDLASDDARKAYQAVHALAAGRTLAVPFLKARMQPIVADPKRIARLIADLDDDAFAVRERATAELEKMGTLARPALTKALATKPPLEARRRIQGLLDRLMDHVLESIVPGECLRTLRALEVLERIGTPEARQVLRAMADGTPEAWLTQEAKAAQERSRGSKR